MAVDSFRFPLRGSNKRGARIGTTPDRLSTIDFLLGIPPPLISSSNFILSLFFFSFLLRSWKGGEIEIFFLSSTLILRYISRILAIEFIREREARCSLFRWQVKIRYFDESTILFLFFLTRIFYEFSVYRFSLWIGLGSLKRISIGGRSAAISIAEDESLRLRGEMEEKREERENRERRFRKMLCTYAYACIKTRDACIHACYTDAFFRDTYSYTHTHTHTHTQS